jgi:hypothetical protein
MPSATDQPRRARRAKGDGAADAAGREMRSHLLSARAAAAQVLGGAPAFD